MACEGPDIKYLFEPRSVAVIGASHSPDKVGYKVVANILGGGYRGRLYPVNPQGGELLGLKVYRDVNEIEDGIDMAVVVIPAKFVSDALRSCAAKGVKFLPIITAGFSEIGNREEEAKLVAYARENGMRILGPNILGVYSGPSSLNATFGPSNVLPGNVAIISQSGALGIALMGKTVVENITLSAFLSIGNKADLDEADLLEYLMNHEATRVILMYMEGVKNGEKMVETLRRATRKKPVVVVKSGRSQRGALAAASHTGALAGSDEVFDAVMRQCQVLRSESLNEALNWCKFFANAPLPKGEKSVIITNGGGLGVLATDACEKYRVKLYDDADDLKQTFSKSMPYFGSPKNPVDITASVDHTYYDSALQAALRNDKINSVAVLYCQVAVCAIENLSPIMERHYREFKAASKPLIFAPVGDQAVEDSMKFLRNHNVPVTSDPYEAVSCLGAMYAYYRSLADGRGTPEPVAIDRAGIDRLAEAARSDGRSFLLADEAQRLMELAGITTAGSRVAASAAAAVKAAGEIGYPVVLKVVSRDILHKSEAGGVLLNLGTAAAVRAGYRRIMESCRAYNPEARIRGVEVCEQVKPGTELILGARRDASFGPIVMCGMGGIYVEVLKDVTFRSYPLTREEAGRMLKDLRVYPILSGVRGQKMRDTATVVEALLKLGAVVKECPQISDIEINPVVVYEKGLKAVDVRVLLSK